MLLSLPLEWAVASDLQLALFEVGALTFASERVGRQDVREFAPTVLISTVTHALELARAATQDGVEATRSTARLVVVTAEPGGSLEATRRTIEDRWGATCLDVYALTELGVVGWGCPERRGALHLDESQLAFDVESLAPVGEQRPDPESGMGELVVTTPAEWDSPLGQFRTGDLVRLQREAACGCGHSSTWAPGGVLGRVRDRLPVRGQLLLPSSIEQVVRRHPAVVDFALKVYTMRGDCQVSVLLEPSDAIASESDLARVTTEVASALRGTFGIRIPCDVVPPGSISTTHIPGHRATRLLVR